MLHVGVSPPIQLYVMTMAHEHIIYFNSKPKYKSSFAVDDIRDSTCCLVQHFCKLSVLAH